jgi:hypothetical protein
MFYVEIKNNITHIHQCFQKGILRYVDLILFLKSDYVIFYYLNASPRIEKSSVIVKNIEEIMNAFPSTCEKTVSQFSVANAPPQHPLY